jgi:predicted esterase YcpF (UPF0227 family)
MSTDTDTRDRVISLESDVKHLSESVKIMASQVAEMHTLLQQAKGARWAIIGAATIGGFVAAKMATVLPWISSFPK